MNISEIEKIIQQGEGLRIEFKEAKTAVPDSFYETVISFSNTDGGTILLGVADDGNVLGIAPNSKVKLQKDIITALNSRDCINPPVFVQPFTVVHSKGEIMVIQIPSSSQVHDHSGKVYSREFEVDLNITNNQQKISDMYLRKRNFFTESQIIPHLEMDDFEPKLFEKARQIIKNNRSDHPWLLVSDEQMLKDSMLWRKDFHTGQEGFTLAAALIFGKDTTIQSILSAYKVEAMVRINNPDRWDDRINPPLRTNLIDTYLALKDFINKHLPEKFYMEGDQRIDLRDKIFREVIGNAIVHREYTSSLSTELIIYKSAVVITNPNKPLFHGIIDPNSFNPYPKNPNIRKFFTAFGWTDEIGSGIRNTNNYLPLYTGGSKPVFLENDTFKTEIPLRYNSMGTFAEKWQQWLNLPPTCLHHLHDGLSTLTIPSAFADADWDYVLLYQVSCWIEKGIKFRDLRWSDNLHVSPEDLKKVPSWNEKGTKLLSKRSIYLISIMMLASKAIKREELMNYLSYENRKSFNDLYLQPLLKEQLIKRTNEENIKDPNQSYYLTEDGKAFISGLL